MKVKAIDFTRAKRYTINVQRGVADGLAIFRIRQYGSKFVEPGCGALVYDDARLLTLLLAGQRACVFLIFKIIGLYSGISAKSLQSQRFCRNKARPPERSSLALK